MRQRGRLSVGAALVAIGVGGAAVCGAGPSFATPRSRVVRPVALRVAPAVGARAVAIASGAGHSCVLTAAGGAQCWGDNSDGQLGDGTFAGRSAPVDVVGLTSGVAAVAAGDHFSCAALVAGGIRCWGLNDSGSLGDGTKTKHALPRVVVGIAGIASSLTAGGHTACAIVSGSAWCWGDNENGEIGDGTTMDRFTPVRVLGPGRWLSVSAGQSYTCGLVRLTPSQTRPVARCWGDNGWGELGDGSVGVDGRTTPGPVRGLGGFAASISAGSNHTCAVLTSGGAQCWGLNQSGELGTGSIDIDAVKDPQDVFGLSSGVASIQSGVASTCAVMQSGAAKCWGDNAYGELGDGTTTNRLSPTPVLGLGSGVQAISRGSWTRSARTFEGYFGCALLTSGAVGCFGPNDAAQLGDGTHAGRRVPVSVRGFPLLPSKSLLWYQPGSGTVFTATLDAGTYTPGRTVTGFATGWTDIAISSDTALFYNRATKAAAAGTYLNGVYTQRSAPSLPTGTVSIAATCSSIVALTGRGVAFYRAAHGSLTLAGATLLSNTYDTAVASCDSVLLYNSITGAGEMGTLIDGTWVSMGTGGFASGWNRIVASDDSIFFMNTSNEHQAYGTFTGGVFRTTASGKGTTCADDRWVATADSVLDERLCGGAPYAYVAKFLGGVITQGPQLLHPNGAYMIVAGGR